MEKNSIPPFYVGQKVVAVKNNKHGAFKKGQEFTITWVGKECACGWIVRVGIIDNSLEVGDAAYCEGCFAVSVVTTSEWDFLPHYFRAITEDFQAITFSEIMERELACVN